MRENDKRTYFNGLAGEWDHLPAPSDAAGKIGLFVERSAVRTPRKILDLGCGTGVLLPALLSRFPETACIVELDFAIDMLRQNASKVPDLRVRRVCADALRLPAAADSFDLALCFGILPHLADKPKALSELLRVLKPGGTLSVGHLMGSRELNAFHCSLNGPVAVDVLPTPVELTEMLYRCGAVRIEAEENPGWYFVRAEKPAC